MSDGLSEARREAAAVGAANSALYALTEALDEVYDCIFGLPSWAITDINDTLAKYGLQAVPDTSAEKKK